MGANRISMNLGFDSKCADLADHFLQDEPAEIVRKRNDLAQAIQDAVEDWFEVEHSPVDGEVKHD